MVASWNGRVSLTILGSTSPVPYLLALTLSIISSNIYTRLALCNYLSFTLRYGDLLSLLMAIF